MSNDEPAAATGQPAQLQSTATRVPVLKEIGPAAVGLDTEVSSRPSSSGIGLTVDTLDEAAADAWFPEYDTASPWSSPHNDTPAPHEAQPLAVPMDEVGPEPTPAPASARSEPEAPAEEQAQEAAPAPAPAPAPTAPEPAAATAAPEQAAAAAETPNPNTYENAPTSSVASPVSPVANANANAKKHYSTLSFTRTVSNDVNWDPEDDDGEWNQSQTEPDPFQFMAPSDRTNSFPAVPQSAGPPQQQQQQPLVSSQSMGIIQDVDEEVQNDTLAATDAPVLSKDQEAAAVDAWDLSGGDNDEDSSFFEGGAPVSADVDEHHEPAWDEPTARYEEGVPLIPSESSGQPEPSEQPAVESAAHAPQPDTKDLFAEADADDDFFKQTSEAGQTSEPVAETTTEAGSFSPPSFERKSTMQVLSSMNVGDLSQKGANVDSPAQSPAKDAPISEEPEAPEATAKPSGSSGDLAAKWAEVFDDEDELLEESIHEADETDAPKDIKELDPATLFGDDDEGFLDDNDDDESVAQTAQTAPAPTATPTPAALNRYAPPTAPTTAPTTSSYAPTAPAANPYASMGGAPTFGYGSTASTASTGQDAARPTLHKAQSFANMTKGGYTSPYDLPMDVVTPMPRKRPSMQYLPKAADATPPPPAGPPARSSSITQSQPPPPAGPMAPPPLPKSTTRSNSFFEDLPILPKARPASRQSQRSPSVPPPAPQAQVPPPPSAQYAQAPAAPAAAAQYAHPPVAQAPSAALAGLVAPPKANPYGSLQAAPAALGSPALPQPAVNRYSPSTHLNQIPAPSGPPMSSRYSPAPPPGRVPSGGYVPSATPPILAHQPRTSSPLAHFEISYDKPRTSSVGGHVVIHGEGSTAELRRSSSSVFDARLHRMNSLPPTREEDEDRSAVFSRPGSSEGSGQQVPPAPVSQTHQYSPVKHRQTPPPQAQTQAQTTYGQATLSPPKRILNYAPAQAQAETVYGGAGARTTPYADPIPVPNRPRAPSQGLNLVPPTDGTETDPLQRWKGVPIFSWGAGGTFVTSFPLDVPRYGISQAQPQIHRAPGAVEVRHIKDIQPLDERLAKFPGPLKGKGKKKEVLAWLSAGIEALEASLPTHAYAQPVSLDDKRLEERVVLWKVLRLLVEHDGALEGTPAVDKAVRAILMPEADQLESDQSEESLGLPGGGAGLHFGTASRVQADTVDSGVVEQIRRNLTVGDKERAVWQAVDKRLWGHAFLVASAASRDLFRKVAQEFVRKEVNLPGHGNESLAALYEVLSGNHDEAVDELVPVHARAGLQLMTTTNQKNQTTTTHDGLAGLDKWRETLSLVLSNRSADDVQAIQSLGALLAGYGRAEAAHVCFMFARSVAVFGGLDDQSASVVLLGADHKGQVDSFAKETDAVLLSEVYEYGLSLAPSSSSATTTAGAPHLAAYKLQHALALAEYGLRDKALQYCDALVAAMGAQTRRSPYYHAVLESAVEDLAKRLKSSPKEESSSWIPKPSMNKVSDTMWNRFNKFVAGDEAETAARGADGETAETGPFARIATGTPTISRPTSSGGPASGGPASGMEMFGGMHSMTGLPPHGFAALNGLASPPTTSTTSTTSAPTRAASRYAPGAQVPATPVMQTYDPNAYTPMMGAVASPPTQSTPYEPVGGYTPLGMAAPVITVPPPSGPSSTVARAPSPYAPAPAPASRHVSGQSTTSEYQPRSSSELAPSYGYAAAPGGGASLKPSLSRKSSYTPLSAAPPAPSTSYAPVAAPTESAETASGYNPYAPASTYEPAEKSQPEPVEKTEPEQPEQDATPSFGGYQPSYGYEAPSYTPYEPAGDDTGKPDDEEGGADATDHRDYDHETSQNGFEPPSFQPYSYEPTDDAEASDDGDAPKPKKKGILDLDDDDDDIPALRKPAEKTREEKDRENAELFRKIAEDEAKRAAEEKEAKAKKGWGLTSWFGAKKEGDADAAPKAVRAKLGEKSSFYFDPEQKRWINKNAGPDEQAAKATPPPPPRSSAGSARSSPAPPMGGPSVPPSVPPMPSMPSVPPSVPPMRPPSAFARPGSSAGPPSGLPTLSPPMARSGSAASTASATPSRPNTGMSEATSIDDLLAAPGAPGGRKAKKGRKSGRYVDVMAK